MLSLQQHRVALSTFVARDTNSHVTRTRVPLGRSACLDERPPGHTLTQPGLLAPASLISVTAAQVKKTDVPFTAAGVCGYSKAQVDAYFEKECQMQVRRRRPAGMRMAGTGARVACLGLGADAGRRGRATRPAVWLCRREAVSVVM